MEYLLGIKFNDFVMLAADTTAAHSIIVMKKDEDKMFRLSNKLLMAISGEAGDAIQFAEYIEKNIQLYKMRNGYELSPKAAATFTRKALADSLRSRNSYQVNLLLAGYDDQSGPELFYMDYLASCISTNFAAHGYGGHFTLSTLDRNYRSDMTEEEGLELMKKCFFELKTRFIVNLDSYRIRVITKDGVREINENL